jgi:hypothetical protein
MGRLWTPSVQERTVFCATSNAAPETSRALHDVERKVGVSMLDVAVSGSTQAAEAGALTYSVGEKRRLSKRPSLSLQLSRSSGFTLVEALRAVGLRRHATPGEVAIAWALLNPAVTGAIVGVRSGEQVRGIAGAADLKLSMNDMLEIEEGMNL